MLIIGYHEEAIRDTNEALEYYDSKSTNLGDRFYNELLNSISIIRAAPHIWPKVSNGASRYLLKHFPFGIFYAYTEDAVEIYAIANLNKRPMHWESRLSK